MLRKLVVTTLVIILGKGQQIEVNQLITIYIKQEYILNLESIGFSDVLEEFLYHQYSTLNVQSGP